MALITFLIIGAVISGANEDWEAQKRIDSSSGGPGKSSQVLPAAQNAASPDSTHGKTRKFSSPKDLHALMDQDGRPFSFARLAKKAVLVNFIFTSCPMKCPTQTQALIAIQRALPPALKLRVEFVSVTVDPDRDSASTLKQYATSMGADLSGWSFVTGAGPELNWLYNYYSVGVNSIKGGLYDHQMGAYLLDAHGRVMQRYTGEIDKPRLLREIGEVATLDK